MSKTIIFAIQEVLTYINFIPLGPYSCSCTVCRSRVPEMCIKL